jgi:DNA-damage-inducible protein J
MIDIVNKIAYIYIQENFMAQTNINIRMDTQLKKQFETFCADVGLTMTAAFNVFAKTSVRLQKIPFEITAETDPFYNESNMKVLAKSIKQLEEGKGIEHELIKA